MKKVVLLLCLTLRSVYALGPFYHDYASIELKPSGPGKTAGSQFGFSISYQDMNQPRLLVGAPKYDFVGKVYSCPLHKTLVDPLVCDPIDMSSLNIESKTKNARQQLNPMSNYFLGASIKATSKYFLVSAPLLAKSITATIKKQGGIVDVSSTDVFGGCFVCDTNGGCSEWVDTTVRLENTFTKKNDWPMVALDTVEKATGGGVGWNTLIDDDFILVSKSVYYGDIMYVGSKDPLKPSKSLLETKGKSGGITYFDSIINMGYSLAGGNFCNRNKKLYAVSTSRSEWTGKIIFLDLSEKMPKIHRIDNKYIELKPSGQRSQMFGYAMAADDLDRDGLSDLLVGEPAFLEENTMTEYGAVHIYIDENHSSREKCGKRHITLIGNSENGRFGSAIATNDIDGDDFPDIIVGAPHENSEAGTVYIISGYYLNEDVIKNKERNMLKVSELRGTQQLYGDGEGRHFGFSLELVKDLNADGCDELAVGSPAGDSVQLLRCLPTVTTHLPLRLIGDRVVKLIAESLTVEVCLYVFMSDKCKNIDGSILVETSFDGATNTSMPKFIRVLKPGDNIMCSNVTIQLTKIEAAKYNFSAKVNMLNDYSIEDKEFKPWAMLSPLGETEKSIIIERYCTGEDCQPKLSCSMQWSGSDRINTSVARNETVTILVYNTGEYSANTAYVRLTVLGGRISTPDVQCYKEKGTRSYSCSSLGTLLPNSTNKITVLHIAKDPTNIPSFSVSAEIADRVFPVISCEPENIEKKYSFDTNLVEIKGSTHDLKVTDKDLEDIPVITDNHEYYITNKGPVKWNDVMAILEVKNETFIQNVKIFLTESCHQQRSSKDVSKIVFNCLLTLEPGAMKIIRVSFNISTKSLESDFKNGNLGTSSTLSVMLLPTKEIPKAISSTRFVYKSILTVANNRTLVIVIIVLVAVLLLLLLIFILHKYGFFKRNQQEKLNNMRESIRRRSVRLASESSKTRKPSTATGDQVEMEVEDCVFQDVDMNTDLCTDDNVELMESTTTAQVHART